jgi:hypothetical protein
MHWELWDTGSGNLVGDYDSEADALAVVRDAVRQHGVAVVATLALGAEHDEEGGDDSILPPVIHGQDLMARAEQGRSDLASDGS